MSITQYLQEILRQFANALMVPAMIILAVLILVAIFLLGSLIVEFATERRLAKQSLPDAINALEDAEYAEVNDVICSTKLLWRQKAALLMVANNAGLPSDALFALAKGEVSGFEARYQRIVGFTNIIAKIAPMMGLVCTLVPLGPGIVGMGNGDLTTLSSSLGVAFDGTVAGLVAAMVAMCVSHIRNRWYGSYQVALEAMMTTVLEKAESEREAGTELPVGFAAADLVPYREKAAAALKEAR